MAIKMTYHHSDRCFIGADLTRTPTALTLRYITSSDGNTTTEKKTPFFFFWQRLSRFGRSDS